MCAQWDRISETWQKSIDKNTREIFLEILYERAQWEGRGKNRQNIPQIFQGIMYECAQWDRILKEAKIMFNKIPS